MTTPADLPIIAVVGATATGKSGLALDLAERLDGEVINADAMQLYRGMEIGTAKLAPKERRAIPHHQLDVLEVTEEASVAVYQESARRDIAAIRRRGSCAHPRRRIRPLRPPRWTARRSHRPTLPCVAGSRPRRPAWSADSMYRLRCKGTRPPQRRSNPQTSGASSARWKSSS